MHPAIKSKLNTKGLLFNKNKLHIVGDISAESFLKFSEELAAVEKKGIDEPIVIELSSGGGVAYDGLAFYSRIRLSPCGFIIMAYGLVASAASIILMAGDVRIMTKESWFMVHEDSGGVEGEVNVMEREIKHMRRMEEQWNCILTKHSKVTKGVWEKMNKETTYLTAQQCLSLGIVDLII